MMNGSKNIALWTRFQKFYFTFDNLGLSLDLSRMNFEEEFLASKDPALQKAFAAMKALEEGAIANPDENRMVGHYWLRNPEIAPQPEIAGTIQDTIAKVQEFAKAVHAGRLKGARGEFKFLLVIGIGGSALGPQFVSQALGRPEKDKMKVFFFDNTDPDGMDKMLKSIPDLGQTLSLVISKSGGTKETRNGMLEAQAAYKKAGLDFSKHAVAITGENSELDQLAVREKWMWRFPMWDWVGGRTSETSAVGLLPAALQGIDIRRLLEGARECDIVTRNTSFAQNPSAQLALMWFHATGGKGKKDMVVIPYKDRLELFSKYLQQLIMESLGKEKDLRGKVVNQGIAVYGNKGSTDQHAYIQQLRDGVANFFVTFIEVLKDREGTSMKVEPGIRSGDYLQGFLLGTRSALYENGRESITITIRDVSPFSIGVLIALYERAVGYYASLVNINAYHQPGVQAGKVAADSVLKLQLKIQEFLKNNPGKPFSIEQIAKQIDEEDRIETIFKICEHLAANRDRKIEKTPRDNPFAALYHSA